MSTTKKTAAYFLLSEGNVKHLLPVEDIVHVQAARVYSVFYVGRPARQYVSSTNIGRIMQQLDPAQFMRVHKSHIINLNEVRMYQPARGGKVILSDSTVIEVSIRRKTQLLQQLRQLNKKPKIDPRATARLKKL